MLDCYLSQNSNSLFYIPNVYNLWFTILAATRVVGGSGELVVSLKAQPSNVVHVGDTVDLLCNFQGKFDRGYSVTWRHVNTVYGEECRAFADGYNLTCSPGKYDTAHKFNFRITSVQWKDRGIWHCAHNFNGSNVDLKVQSPAPLTSLKPLPRSNGKKVEGTGTRTSPYNLLAPNLTQFECSTGCGHPMPNVKWTFSNRTSSGSLNQFVSGTDISNCAGEGRRGMTSSRSVFNVKNCTEMGLYGHLRVTCSLTGGQYRRVESRSFFIVCPDGNLTMTTPGEVLSTSVTPTPDDVEDFNTTISEEMSLTTSQPYGGVPALMLTHGEIIGIAVGCAMALILTFLFIFWFYRKRAKALRHTTV